MRGNVKRIMTSKLALVLILVVVALLIRTGAAEASVMAAYSCGQWSSVKSPNEGVNSLLSGVAIVSANDVWAVGFYEPNSNGPYQTLIEHWDGTSWSIVSSPSQGPSTNSLYSVTAVASDDVWAVGYYIGSGNSQTLIEHWDGTQWSIVSSPNAGSGENYLYGVTALSTNDVWAIGSGSRGTLTEHWNGTQWSIVKSPNTSVKNNYLTAVAATSTSDVWAVGRDFQSYRSKVQTLIEHWDGTQWTIISSPNVQAYVNRLVSVTAVSTNDVWTVGYYYFRGVAKTNTLIEHWDGTQWSIVKSPTPGGGGALNGVAAVSSSDIWAVGSTLKRNLSEHWDGTRWSIFPTPNPGQYSAGLAVAALSANDVWAVGTTSSKNQKYKTFTTFYC